MASNESGGAIHAVPIGFPEKAVTAANPKTTLTDPITMTFLVSNAKNPPSICLASQIIIQLLTQMANAINHLLLVRVDWLKGRHRTVAHPYEISTILSERKRASSRPVLAVLCI
jgi:hypothetical protein